MKKLLRRRALPHELLRALLIVPEPFAEAQVRQAVDVVLQPVEVKDTSPALPCAVRGLGVGRGFPLQSCPSARTYRDEPDLSKGHDLTCLPAGFPVHYGAMRRRVAAIIAGLLALAGCDTEKVAAGATAQLLERAAPGVEQHWDYDLVGKSFPANIIQLEGLLRIVPDNETLGMALVAAYLGYGTGWIEDRVEVADFEDAWEEADHLRRRALVMYTRAWDLSKHFLRNRYPGFDDALRGGVDSLDAWLNAAFTEKEDAAILLWSGASLGARINMGMEDIDTVADLPLAKVILGRSIALDPDFMFRVGQMTMATLAASEFPPDMERAKALFDEVLEKTERRNLMVQLNMARHYAVNVGDHELFSALLHEVIEAGDVLPEARLSNVIARRKAERYLDQIEYFFSELSE